MRLDIAAQSDIGRRKDNNEDYYGVFLEDTPDLQLFSEGALICVADGLGGHMGGEIASKLAVSMFKDVAKEDPAAPVADEDKADADEDSRVSLMRKFVHKANSSVFQTNADMGTGNKPMGTTLICGLVTPRKLYLVNVGDSRCYHIRDNEIIGCTEDHSWVDEQVKLGLMSKAEAQADFRKNVVTRSVGTRAEVSVDSYLWHIVPGDWLLLCTDGLVNMVDDKVILHHFEKGGSASEIAARLVEDANENGGKDNITVVVANISPSVLRLAFMGVRSFCRKQGLKLLWLIITAAAFGAGWYSREYFAGL